MRASIKHETRNGVLILTDLYKGSPHVSVTNDAQGVIEYAIRNLGLTADMPVILCDVDKKWDQMVHDGTEFLGFKPLNQFEKDKAVLLVQDPDQDSGGDFWNYFKIKDQERRAANREVGPQVLVDNGITSFVIKNLGAHIIIGQPPVANYWPGTGRWSSMRNKNVNGRGAKGLVDWLKKFHPQLLKGERA